MRKVIGFKLALRPKEIQRRAKKAAVDLAAAGLADIELEGWLSRTARATTPAVLFETFPHTDADQGLLSPLPGLAYSLILATLGPGWAGLRERDHEENAARDGVWPLLEELALEETARFVTSLLEDEAAKDACELSPLTRLTEPAALEAVLRKLQSQKIGVSLSDGRVAPAASGALSLSWLSKSKAKKPK